MEGLAGQNAPADFHNAATLATGEGSPTLRSAIRLVGLIRSAGRILDLTFSRTRNSEQSTCKPVDRKPGAEPKRQGGHDRLEPNEQKGGKANGMRSFAKVVFD
jgi:hypothetical protein